MLIVTHCFSESSEDLEMPKRRRDQKKKNGQSSKEQSSIDCRIVDERQEKADSEKEKGTKNLTDNEKTATCKGMYKKNVF